MSKYLGVFSFTWISTHGDWEKHVRNDLSPVLELLGYEFKKWGQLAYYCPMTLLDEPQAVKAAVYEASFAPMHLSVCREPPVFDIPGLLTLMLYFETAAFAGFRGGALKPRHLPEDEWHKIVDGLKAQGHGVDYAPGLI